jgi:GR25 family glycosyltransferase involved in LPS biosynthesis
MNDTVFYINLDSRTDRRKKMENQFQKFQITNSIRIPAINSESAKVLTDLSDTLLDVRTRNNLNTKSKTSHMDIDGWGAAGCFLSHVKAWKSILERKLEKAWVLEDDANITSVQSINVSSQTPFVWLGLKGNIKTKPQEYGRKEPFLELDYDRTQFGAHAYCIHSSLLPIFLHHAERSISLSVDFFINETCLLNKIYIGYYPLTTTNEFLSFSDIDHFTLVTDKSSSFWKKILPRGVSKIICVACVFIFVYLFFSR